MSDATSIPPNSSQQEAEMRPLPVLDWALWYAKDDVELRVIQPKNLVVLVILLETVRQRTMDLAQTQTETDKVTVAGRMLFLMEWTHELLSAAPDLTEEGRPATHKENWRTS